MNANINKREGNAKKEEKVYVGIRDYVYVEMITEYSQKCLAGIVGAYTCSQLLRVLNRAVYHFKDISIII